MATGSHHQPLSHAKGVGATGRHTLAIGSHHWPKSHPSGTRGRHTLPTGSHYWSPLQSAELMPGDTTVTNAIDAIARVTHQ